MILLKEKMNNEIKEIILNGLKRCNMRLFKIFNGINENSESNEIEKILLNDSIF